MQFLHEQRGALHFKMHFKKGKLFLNIFVHLLIAEQREQCPKLYNKRG